jgi:hypothetical protein
MTPRQLHEVCFQRQRDANSNSFSRIFKELATSLVKADTFVLGVSLRTIS